MTAATGRKAVEAPTPPVTRRNSWPLSWSLAWRYLRGRRSGLLASTARAALLSTSMGVTAMVVAMALMTGYTEDLQRKLIGNAAVIAYPLLLEEVAGTAEARVARLESIPGVARVSRVVYGQGSLSSAHHPQGVEVTLRGVDSAAGAFGASPSQLRTEDGVPGAILGKDLARRLGTEEGEILRLVAVGLQGRRPDFEYRSVRFAGTFSIGFAESDRHWLILDRSVVESLGRRSSLYEISVAGPDRVSGVMRSAEAVLGEDYMVTDWRQYNRELFTALRLQKTALFLILGLIVVVSTFNVASALVVMVRERMRDVGALAALGLAPGKLQTVFLLCGGALGGVGAALGVLAGTGLSWILTRFELIRFDPDVAAIYFISSVPFRVELLDVLAVVTFTLGVTLVACWSPARRAARIEPAVALRYE